MSNADWPSIFRCSLVPDHAEKHLMRQLVSWAILQHTALQKPLLYVFPVSFASLAKSVQLLPQRQYPATCKLTASGDQGLIKTQPDHKSSLMEQHEDVNFINLTKVLCAQPQ